MPKLKFISDEPKQQNQFTNGNVLSKTYPCSLLSGTQNEAQKHN